MDPDEEIPQENSETTALTSTTEDFEEPMAESSWIQIAENNQIQTSPGPGPLSGHGKLSKCSEDELLSDEDSIPHSDVQISDDDDDQNQSDEDYIPDSEFQDDEDSDMKSHSVTLRPMTVTVILMRLEQHSQSVKLVRLWTRQQALQPRSRSMMLQILQCHQ
ncbi:uncharacterized protein PAE49_003408 isoform 2-T2 [Odontesthes bonariensis]